MKKISRYLPILCLIIFFILFAITRIWRVSTIPSGIHIDEAGSAYDGWCLANYGVDRYLNSYPVYFINFGGGQNALYTYLCAFLFCFLPFSVFTIRIPAILSSFLNFFFGMLIAKKLYRNDKTAFLTGFLLLICPYFILAGRFGLESNLMLGLSTVFLYLFYRAISEKPKLFFYLLTGFIGGILLYTYAISYLVLPLFLLCSFAYLLWTRRFSLKGWIMMAVPMGILAFPLIAVQIINIFDLPQMQLGIFTLTKLPYYRGSEIHLFRLEYLWNAIKVIFVGDWLQYNTAPGFPNLYSITIIFFIIGLANSITAFIKTIKNREFSPFSFIMFWFLSMLFVISHLQKISVNNINGIFFTVILISVDGIVTICKLVQKLMPPRILVSSILIAYSLLFLRFGFYYLNGSYTKDNYPINYFDILVPEAIDFLDAHPEYQHKGTYMAETDLYYALSTFQSPYELQFYGESKAVHDGYITGALPEIDTDYNYIVRDTFTEYADELRAMGFHENKYVCYSLFYME